MENLSGIYKINNNITNDFYIGSAKNLYRRKAVHFSQLLNNKHPNIRLQRSVDKYGIENFEFEILITCNPEMLIWYEQQFLDQLNPAYNINKKAESRLGTPQSKKVIETTRRLAKQRRGTPKPVSYSEKLSERMKGNKLGLGRKMSEENKLKLLETNKGNKYFLGRKHTEETKEKMRQSQRLRFSRLRVEKEGRNGS